MTDGFESSTAQQRNATLLTLVRCNARNACNLQVEQLRIARYCPSVHNHTLPPADTCGGLLRGCCVSTMSAPVGVTVKVEPVPEGWEEHQLLSNSQAD